MGNFPSKRLGCLLGCGGCSQLGQTKIRQLGIAVAGHQNIGRLNIAVRNPSRVRGQPVGHTHHQRYDQPPSALFLSGPIFQRASIHELGDQVLPPFQLAGIIHCQNMGMVERALAEGEADVPFTDIPATFNPNNPKATTRMLAIRKIDGLFTPKDQFFAVQHLGRPEFIHSW